MPLCLERLDHGRQIDVGEAVAVVGEEHLLALDMGAHRKQALADVPPQPGVDHGDAPVALGIAEGLDRVAEARDHAVRIDMRPVVQEELLDDVRLVAEAEHEIAVAVLAVVMHQVPEDRLVADRDHRLRDVLRIIANSGAETAAEQNCFHGLDAVPHHLRVPTDTPKCAHAPNGIKQSPAVPLTVRGPNQLGHASRTSAVMRTRGTGSTRGISRSSPCTSPPFVEARRPMRSSLAIPAAGQRPKCSREPQVPSAGRAGRRIRA